MGIFTDIFSDQPAKDAAAAKIAGINNGLTSANNALDNGMNTATPLYGQAYGNFSNLAGKFGQGQDAYNDATGVNGADGVSRASSIFRSLPGYQSGFDLANNANDRLAASRGILASGNTMAASDKLATDYADQHYQNYVNSLAPNLTGALASTSGGASVLNNQANANLNVANQRAQYGNNAATGIGNANADAITAKYSASKNFWGALAGTAQLAFGMPPTAWSGMGSTSGGSSGGSGSGNGGYNFSNSPISQGWNAFSGPSYGGGNVFSGDAYGGSSSNPLQGLSASDYGVGF